MTPASISGALVESNSDIWSAMPKHPWMRALADGTLPDAALIAYAQQCRLLIVWELRALHTLRAYNPPTGLDHLLASLIVDTEAAPAELAELLRSLGANLAVEAWPVCLGYSAFLLACARDGLLEGLTALYASDRAYLDTCAAILPEVPKGSRMRSWVENWSSGSYRDSTIGIGRWLDNNVGAPSNSTLERLNSIFRSVAHFEMAFWEMSWTGQEWPSLEPPADT